MFKPIHRLGFLSLKSWLALLTALLSLTFTSQVSAADWSNLATATKGGPNVAYVDYASLDASEQAQIRQLDANEVIKTNWRYKLVYTQNETSTSSTSTPPSASAEVPSTPSSSSTATKTEESQLPLTGEQITVSVTVLGLIFIGGALVLAFSKKSRVTRGLLLLLAASGTIGIGSTVAKAYSGSALSAESLIATDTIITPPTIEGYHYVGVISIPSGTVIARYVDTDGNEVAESVTVADEADVDTAYNTEQKNIDGYQFKELAANSAAISGTVIDGKQTVTYVYEQLGTYKLYLDITLPTPTTYSTNYDIGLEWWKLNDQSTTDYMGLLDPSNQAAIPSDRYLIRLGHPLTVKYQGTTLQLSNSATNTYSILVGTTSGQLGSQIQRIDTSDILDDISVEFLGNTYSLTEFNTYLSNQLTNLYPNLYPNLTSWGSPYTPTYTTTSFNASADTVYQQLTEERYNVTLNLNIAIESPQL